MSSALSQTKISPRAWRKPRWAASEGPLSLPVKKADAIAMGGQNPGSFVGRSAVDYDDFEIGVILGEDARKGFRQVARHIEGRRNDGNQGEGGGIHGHTHYINPDTEGLLVTLWQSPQHENSSEFILRAGRRFAFSASSDQPNRRRPGRKFLADHPRGSRGAGPGGGPDGHAGAGTDGLSSTRPADEPGVYSPGLRETIAALPRN